jgi:hypothetical protein
MQHQLIRYAALGAIDHPPSRRMWCDVVRHQVFDSEVTPSERAVELFPFPKRNNAFGQVFAQVTRGRDRRV